METETSSAAAPLEAPKPSGSEEKLWKRLDELLARVEKGWGADPAGGKLAGPGRWLLLPLAPRSGVGTLDAGEIGELSRLYRAATTRLAQLQTFGASARRLERLNRLVARAHAVVYGKPPGRSAGRVLLEGFLNFPVVVRRTIGFHALAAALIALGALYGFFGAAADPEWALEFLPQEDSRTPYASREELLETLMAGREGHTSVAVAEKSGFAAFLWAHNTRVALICFFCGALLGIPTILMLLSNGAMLGVFTATFHRHGLDAPWWAWVLPHGVTELLAIILLAGGGLYMGYTILAPGLQSRARALAAIRGSLICFVLFAFPMLQLAALVEAFLRQSNLSDSGRIAFAIGSALFWALYLGLARPPAALRESGERRATLGEARIPLPDTGDLFGVRKHFPPRQPRAVLTVSPAPASSAGPAGRSADTGPRPASKRPGG